MTGRFLRQLRTLAKLGLLVAVLFLIWVYVDRISNSGLDLIIGAGILHWFRKEWDSYDEKTLGTTCVRIPVNWALLPNNPTLSKFVFALALVGVTMQVAISFADGIAQEWFVPVGAFVLLACAAVFIAGVWALFKRPYRLTIGTRGLAWKGETYSYQTVSAAIDERLGVLRIQVPQSNIVISLKSISAEDVVHLNELFDRARPGGESIVIN